MAWKQTGQKSLADHLEPFAKPLVFTLCYHCFLSTHYPAMKQLSFADLAIQHSIKKKTKVNSKPAANHPWRQYTKAKQTPA